jgi:chemotaxis protein methyltransferase CheR
MDSPTKRDSLIPDPQGVQFLQWCLPRLHLRWRGFRKVRRQVYKRINRRLQELGLPNIAAYRAYLEDHPGEWPVLDDFCRIGISRFYRDRSVFQYLEHEVLPQLAQLAIAGGEDEIRCWSAGCARGEEPYTLAIIWRDRLAMQFPKLGLRIVATDIDFQAIRRAERGCYSASSVKELPTEWRTGAFVPIANELCLKDEYRTHVTFMAQDIREQEPEGLFHLILCRNLVFTYFDEALQQKTLQRLADRLAPGGALVIGRLESLPDGFPGIQPWSTRLGVHRKSPETQREA